jgi:putative ABC transport system ATP-binding protein
VDYAAAGEPDAAVHRTRTLALAEAAGMGADLVVAALGTRLAEAGGLGRGGRLAAARPAVAAALAAEGIETAVEPWDRAALCENASLLENLLFALPDGAAPDAAAILARRDVARALVRGGAEPLLAEIGIDLARAFAGLAATVSADSPLLDRVGSYGRADVLAGAALAPRLPEPGQPLREPALRRTVVALAARYTPVRDRFDVLTPERIARLLGCRAAMAGEVARLDGFAAPDAAAPPASLTIAEALLGGRRREDRRAVWRRLEAALVEAATAAGLRETLLDLGLDAPAGGKGASLGPGMKARIALVRCALKRPALVVIADPALAADTAARRFLREALPQAVMLFGADHGAILDDADAIARLDADGTVALDAAA